MRVNLDMDSVSQPKQLREPYFNKKIPRPTIEELQKKSSFTD